MIKHAIFEGFKNLVRSTWLSFTAISVLSVSLGSVALVSTLSTIVGFSVRQLDNQISIVAYFKEDIDQKAIDSTKSDLSKVTEIKTVKFINREDAQKRLQESSTVADNLVKSLQKSNIKFALEYLEITPTSSETYNKVEDLLRSDAYKDTFSEVQATKNFIQNLQKIYNWTRIIGGALVVVFASISILVMSNILRIAIYSFRDEIEIMRLVGATNNYIRAPFIAEGAYFNLIAALLVVVLFVPSLNALIPQIELWLQIKVTSNSSALIYQIYLSLALTIFSGILVGVLTSYAATQKYLKL